MKSGRIITVLERYPTKEMALDLAYWYDLEKSVVLRWLNLIQKTGNE